MTDRAALLADHLGHADEHTPCDCSHDLADHREHTADHLRGATSHAYIVTMPCGACECRDYQETP